ncbi:MAG: hypothetical protein AAF968_08325, partial [Pseudomonadota bacterium]
LNGLIGLASVALGLAVVSVARFLFATENRMLYPVLPRAATSLALLATAFVSLVAAHHLLFLIVNGQLSLLGSAFAYCYANFADLYIELFWMIVIAGIAALVGLLVLPEALRLTYSK